MSAPTSPSPRTSPVCRLPDAVSLTMVFDLLRALPRPPIGGPAQYGRLMIRDALDILWGFQPRDVTEAMLAIQIIVLDYLSTQATITASAHQGKPEEMMRWEKHAMALQRRSAAARQQFRAHRRELATRGEAPEARPGWTYDLAALEAAWRKKPVLVRTETEDAVASAEAEVEWPEGEVMELPAVEGAAMAGEASLDLSGVSALPLSRAGRRRMEKMQRKLAVRLASRLVPETRQPAA